MHDLLKIIQKITGIKHSIRNYNTTKNGKKFNYNQIQFTSKPFYDYLCSIGITPNNTETISSIKVPEEYFPDFLRAVIDADGNYNHQNNSKIYYIRIFGGSKKFLNWLNDKAITLFDIHGGTIRYEQRDKGSRYILSYQSNYDIISIVERIYCDEEICHQEKKEKISYILKNKEILKKRYTKNKIGTRVKYSYKHCDNYFIAKSHNQLYCKKTQVLS